jgi:hypothetical protein
MKKNTFITTLFALIALITTLSFNTNSNLPIGNEEIIKGLKDALNIGIENAVKSSSATDGFWKNTLIKLPFPEDAKKVKETALKFKMNGQVEKFETTLNRAAEEASKEATPIFIKTIKNMTINDGLKILNGGDGAATNYLQTTTSSELKTAFLPKVKLAIEKVQLTKYWKPLISKYNTVNHFTGGQNINTDLNAYVTEKAISGLFKLVTIEENKIRKDPDPSIKRCHKHRC